VVAGRRALQQAALTSAERLLRRAAELAGAPDGLIAAELLAEVWLAMTRGQDSLTIDIVVPMAIVGGTLAMGTLAAVRVVAPSADELDLHHAYLAELQRESRGACLWIALAS